MREIKFRGKRVHDGKWIYGYYIQQNGRGVDGADDCIIHQIISKSDGSFQDIIPETVGQFTGLTDKNGSEIYEGDIVFNKNKTLITCEDDSRIYLVEWKNGEFDSKWLKQKPSFVFTKINTDKNYMSLVFNQNQIEIIGNIHDKN